MNKRGHVLNALLLALGLGFVIEPGLDMATARTVAEITVPIVVGALFPDVDTAFGRHRKTLPQPPSPRDLPRVPDRVREPPVRLDRRVDPLRP